MASAIAEIVELIVSTALQIGLSFWLIRRDDRRLTGIHAARGFPPATFWIAVVVFGPLSIPIHFLRTRRSWSGLGLGLLWFFAVFAVIAAAGWGLSLFLE